MLVVAFSAIVCIFWYSEWKYNLPTPVPMNYVAVSTGKRIDVPVNLFKNNKPLFIHFFNPDCPCSKFNIPSFKALVSQYSNDVNFAIVVMSDKHYSAEKIKDKFDLDVPVLFDTSIATKCGVYSTPQAVILNQNQQLYYRGNYNRSRYCTDPKTSYAQIALNSMLHQNKILMFNHYALQAYGCELPKYSK